MGLSLRKSVSVGPFRFNLSGSGVGMSVGFPGFRVGSGPRGNYVHLRMGAVQYRQTISPPRERPSLPALVPIGTHAPLEAIESADAALIADSSSEQLLAEIREKRRRIRSTPFAIVMAIVTAFFAAGSGWFFAVAILGTALIAAARYFDKVRRTTVILYDFDPAVGQAFGRFSEWAEALAGSHGKWHIAGSGRVHDRKYHAGASNLVQRHATPIRNGKPPLIETNVPVLSIGAGRQTLYFLPDRLLVCDGNAVGAVSYRTLDLSVTSTRFIEEGSVPPDARVVDRTWRYVNRNGGPDRRFNNNPQLPVCQYDELTLRTTSGLNEVIQISRTGIGAGFASAVQHLASVVS